MKAVLKAWALAGAIVGVSGCSAFTLTRLPAAQSDSLAFKYITLSGPTASTEVVTSDEWVNHFDEARRDEFLIKLYLANTKEDTDSGLRHAACFEGDGHQLIERFFKPANAHHHVRWGVSEDGRKIGVSFSVMTEKGRQGYRFRISNCQAGKAPMVDGRGVGPGPVPAKIAAALKDLARKRRPAGDASGENGFTINDPIEEGHDALPAFELRADYDRVFVSSRDRPWKGMDIRDEVGAMRFALLLQKYFYENMANQDPSHPDLNFIAQKNTQRYWCQMPWLNVGDSGREAIHGLNKEQNLVPSASMALYGHASAGTDVSVAYYNAPGCMAIGQVFGSDAVPKDRPDFTRASFPDGSVAAKLLFTTANFPEIEGTLTWNAHVSALGSTHRTVQPVRHIQMDVSVRDSSLLGIRHENNDWVMLTYYYDPTFSYEAEYRKKLGTRNPLKAIPNLPAKFLHMRPMGIQTGFDRPETGDTRIFTGSQTNGYQGRLNGPADFARSSCLSCHGTAGTKVPMAPGFLSQAAYDAGRTGSLDFSQQFNSAKENFETSDR